MPGRDILSADKYGKLVPVMPPGFQVVLSPGPAVAKIKKVIKEYKRHQKYYPIEIDLNRRT